MNFKFHHRNIPLAGRSLLEDDIDDKGFRRFWLHLFILFNIKNDKINEGEIVQKIIKLKENIRKKAISQEFG